MTGGANDSGHDGRLQSSHAFARANWLGIGDKELEALLSSHDGDERLRGLFLLQERVGHKGHLRAWFDLARPLMDDEDNDCRWQAFITVGEFITAYPDDVWELVHQYGGHEDEDMRAATATVLLEHLAEHDMKYLELARDRATRSDRWAELVRWTEEWLGLRDPAEDFRRIFREAGSPIPTGRAGRRDDPGNESE